MGVFVTYLALPEDSFLYQELGRDSKLAMMFSRLMNWEGGPFVFLERDRDVEVIDLMEELATTLPFESMLDVDETRELLIDLLRHARIESPDIMEARCTLEKSSRAIGETLEALLDSKGIEGAAEIVDRLLFGDVAMHPGAEVSLSVLSVQQVARGQQLLESIDPEDLFDRSAPLHDHYRDNFARWKSVLHKAADHKYIVVLEVS